WQYDALGRLTDLFDAKNIDRHYEYDGLSRTSFVTENCTGLDSSGHCSANTATAPYDFNIQTQYLYDVMGNLLHVTSPAGGQVNYGYDAANRRTSVTDAANGAIGSRTWTTTYDK